MVDVKMKYSSMEKMAKQFAAANKQIEESMRAMKKIVKMLNEGGLQGDGGTEFENAINSKLLPRMKNLSQKMAEMDKDIKQAVQFTRDGVSKAKNRFT